MKKIMKNGKINGLLNVYGIIYMVKNKVNGKCYIGQTYQQNGFRQRYGAKHNQSLIEALYESHKQVINKVNESERENVYLRDELLQEMEQYGLDAFEVIEVIDCAFSQAELDIKEKVYISLYKSLVVENIQNVKNTEDFNIPSDNGIFIVNNTSNYGIGGYNKTSGGSGFKWTERAKQNARDAWNDDMKAAASKRATLMWEDPEMREHLINLITESWSDLSLRKHVSEVLQEFWKDEKHLKDASEFSKLLWENEEYREKVSEGLRKAWENEEYRNKVIDSVREALSKPETRTKMSNSMKALWKQEDFRELMSEKHKEYWKNDINREKRSEKLKEVWSNEDLLKKHSEKMSEVCNREDYKKKMSEVQKKSWDNEEKRKRHSKIQKEAQNRPEVKKRVSEKSKDMWKDQNRREKILEARKKANERPEVKANRSKATRGGNNCKAKSVICLTSIEKNYDRKIFAFMGEAAEWANSLSGCTKLACRISECCNGTRQFWGKMPDGTLLKWKFLKDFDKDQIKELFTSVKLTNEEKAILFNQFGTF